MRIGCLQFAPQVGDIDNNLNRADAVLSKANPKDLDLLVLPEMAFSGYNFRSLQHISPYLEPTTSGISSLWARTTALKHNCVVMVGYPEKVDLSPKWPASPEYYNSAIVVNSEGETIANYRKSFLYYTDETWALEGPDGFYDGEIDGLGNVAMGICKWPTKSFERMDLNPYKFEAPWSAWEFAYHILYRQANLVVLSMAWLTREDARPYSRYPKDPDMETLSYWLARLEPVIRAEGEGEIIVVLANRSGTEEEAVYAGTSAVLGIQGGEVKVYGILGRGEKELLVVDTDKRPQAKLISQPNSASSTVDTTATQQSTASTNTAASGLSVNTGFTSPDVGSFPQSMAEIMTPLTPVEANSPNAYFISRGKKRDPPKLQTDLKSSVPDNAPDTPFEINSPFDLGKQEIPDDELKSLIDELKLGLRGETPDSQPQQLRSNIPQPQFTQAVPNSPTFQRPPSPKSRNASRTRYTDVPLTLPAPNPEISAQEDKSTEQTVHAHSASHEAIPGSPTFQRPASPKSRNASRTRHVDAPAFPPALVPRDPCQDVGPGERDLPITSGSHEEVPDAPTYHRPSSPKSQNVSRKKQIDVPQQELSLKNYDLANGVQVTERSVHLQSTVQGGLSKSPKLPHSAAAVPERYQSAFTSNTFGPRHQYVIARPRSAVW